MWRSVIRGDMSTNHRRKAEDPIASRITKRPMSTNRWFCLDRGITSGDQYALDGLLRCLTHCILEHSKSQGRDIQVCHRRCWSYQNPSCLICTTRNRTRRCDLYSREGCFQASNHCRVSDWFRLKVSKYDYWATHR